MTTHYAAIMHALLTGEIIDEYRYPELYRALHALENSNDFEENIIRKDLRRLERELCSTDNNSGYYAALAGAPTPAQKAALNEQFKEYAEQILPLVEWLRLTRITHPDNRPTQSGDTVSQAELLKHIEQSKPLEGQLKDIARAFKSSASVPKEQLNSILKKLSDNHYLEPVGTSGAVYRATAKWDVFYEQMAYLQNAASIALPSLPETEQQSLFSTQDTDAPS